MDQGRSPASLAAPDTTTDAALLERALFEIKKVIVGQDRMVERMLVALLARGHCLLEGVPGVAKTLAVQTLATVVGGSFVRIQFTNDLVPSDIVGARIYKSTSESFDVELGPVFANFVLADEINRAPAKVQSALLEIMSEKQVSLGGVTHPLPRPFLVLATQNPIESEGVYPLPEAQRDRFLMKVTVPYPSPAEELEIVRRMGVRPPVPEPVLDPAKLLRLQERADNVFVHHAIVEFAVNLVLATRAPEQAGLPELRGQLAYGASPRASLGLIAAARALGLLRGRDYVVPDDVIAVALDVLPHRLVLSYEALAEGLSADAIAARIVSSIVPPQVAPRQQAPYVTGGPGGPYTGPHTGGWGANPRSGFPEYLEQGPRG
ncbi:MoxR family ATPase [Frankia sp. Ag45/Mut15]|uniref:MoxR family ATPase n=1 Tax=Frankia umida TaxID=573489 RepID=A0ABT0JX65_9ACTN|nr:MoxR family ATPase [Frankia umida]MCK9876081.1 MoxR family ATPase [Frankia umida]